jgi:hypothetical protein
LWFWLPASWAILHILSPFLELPVTLINARFPHGIFIISQCQLGWRFTSTFTNIHTQNFIFVHCSYHSFFCQYYTTDIGKNDAFGLILYICILSHIVISLSLSLSWFRLCAACQCLKQSDNC